MRLLPAVPYLMNTGWTNQAMDLPATCVIYFKGSIHPTKKNELDRAEGVENLLATSRQPKPRGEILEVTYVP
jgi:hypothetical protein